MKIPKKILAIDVGSGTQDILIYEDGKPMENCVQMILPSPTQIIARRIEEATASGEDIYLSGNTMGGGPCAYAVAGHLQAGLKVFATESAALTFHDRLEEIAKMGIRVTGRPPRKVRKIRLGDVDLPALRLALKPFAVNLPSDCAIAVQDHGFNPGGSNRRFRFRHWEKFLAGGGRLTKLLYRKPPWYMTRMASVQRDVPGATVMDTCAAAVWGILCDPLAAAARQEGLIALNIGNQHTFGALIQGDRIWGIFEHHTGFMTPAKLASILTRFPRGLLGNEEVFADRGHGCAVDSGYRHRRGFRLVVVTGPRRALAEGLGAHMAVPYGDMMLTGCFGLIAALKAKAGAGLAENAGKRTRKSL